LNEHGSLPDLDDDVTVIEWWVWVSHVYVRPKIFLFIYPFLIIDRYHKSIEKISIS